MTKYRLILYQVKKWAQHETALGKIEALTASDRQTVKKLLRSNIYVSINNLEDSKAREAVGFFKNLGMDCEMEPMELEGREREWFLAEARKWLKRGWMTGYMLQLILSQYGLAGSIPLDLSGRAEKKDVKSLLRTLIGIGAVLIGLGIILFIAANWQRIPVPVKILGSLAISLGFLHAGAYFKFTAPNQKELGTPFLFIASISMGGTILLIGQIYHVLADSHMLPLVWGFVVLPLVFHLETPSLIYLASGLWFLAESLYGGSHEHFYWLYPVLMLGFLLPYSLKLETEKLLIMNIVLMMIAGFQAIGPGDHWINLLWVCGFAYLSEVKKQRVYDYLLMASFACWNLSFMAEYEKFPNVFYLLPVALFFWRGLKRRDTGLIIANIFNVLYWKFTLFMQFEERFKLQDASGTALLLDVLALGVFFYGIGKRLEASAPWQKLSKFCRYFGAFLTFTMAYLFSFRFYKERHAFFDSLLYFGSTLFYFALGGVLAFPVLRREALADSRRVYEPAVFLLVCTSFVLNILVQPSHSVHVLVYNLILFFGAMAFMLKGYRERRIGLYNIGIALFVLLIVSRYFDTFWYFMPRSVFFMLGGAFLIGWAVSVDRQRKKGFGSEPAS